MYIVCRRVDIIIIAGFLPYANVIDSYYCFNTNRNIVDELLQNLSEDLID